MNTILPDQFMLNNQQIVSSEKKNLCKAMFALDPAECDSRRSRVAS